MIKYAPLNINKIRNLIADVQNGVSELDKLVSQDFELYRKDSKNYGLTEHYFRRALEAMLTIGTHFLSRLPAKTKDYTEVIVSLGKFGIVPQDFADRNRGLAGYRNRLVHLYWEVSEEELYKTVKDHLKDLDEFCEYFQKVLENPEKYNLKID